MRKTQYDQLKDLSQEIDLLKREVFVLRSINLRLSASEADLIARVDRLKSDRAIESEMHKRWFEQNYGVMQ